MSDYTNPEGVKTEGTSPVDADHHHNLHIADGFDGDEANNQPDAVDSVVGTDAIIIESPRKMDEEVVESDEKKPAHIVVVGLCMLVLFGMLEGFTFQACGIASPVAIRGQMIFNIWVVLKFFVAAVGASALFQSLLSIHNEKAFDQSRYNSMNTAGLPRMVSGSFVLGIGLCLAACGPSMVPTQIGAGVTYAGVTLIGLILGGVLYAVIERVAGIETDTCVRPTSPIQIDKILGVPYSVLAFPMGVGMLALAVGLEFIVPHSDDGPKLRMGRTPPVYPAVCGAIIGLIQMPVRLISGKGQCGSVPVMQLVATLSRGHLSKRFQIQDFEQTYQLFVLYVGSIFGAFIALMWIPHFDRVHGYEWYYCLIGGILMLFGARIANGCACGNGVTGVSELSWHAFFGAGAMFAGAVATGYIMDAAGAEMLL